MVDRRYTAAILSGSVAGDCQARGRTIAEKMEVPVRKILMGLPVRKAANPSAMANPRALDAFVDYALNQRDYRVV